MNQPIKRTVSFLLALTLMGALTILPVQGAGEATESTAPEETESIQAEESTAPEEAVSPLRLSIDNQHIYEGMDRAYQQGYSPTVKDGVLTVVLPLLADGSVEGNAITVTPELGYTADSPIQVKNYQKTVSLTQNPVSGQEEPMEGYLVWFDFPLSADRVNGVYSLTLVAEATGGEGTAVSQSYVCYYSITDGKRSETQEVAEPEAVEDTTPESKPKIIVSRYSLDTSPVSAGSGFTATITLQNTSETQPVQNMLVTVGAETDSFVLENDSNSIYIDSIPAGETRDITLTYATDLDTQPGRYAIDLSMEYDDSQAVTLSAQGSILVEVTQVPRVELSPFQIQDTLNAGETFQLTFQAMNLGRSPVYNVRVEVDVPGLSPVGTAFIGNLEEGTSGSASVNVFVGMVSTEGDRYGDTAGVVRLLYEDASGQEYTETVEVSTTIQELVINAAEDSEEAETESRSTQWWLVAVAGGLIALGVGLFLVLSQKRGTR